MSDEETPLPTPESPPSSPLEPPSPDVTLVDVENRTPPEADRDLLDSAVKGRLTDPESTN